MASVSKWDILFCLLVVTLGCHGYRQYDSFHVIKVTADRAEQLDFLHHLTHVDVWKVASDGAGGVTATFHIHGDHVTDILQTVTDRQLKYNIISDDLQRFINNERSTGSRRDMFDHYYNFDELQTFLTDQVAACGSLCSLEQIGTSFEGRPLNLIKITGAPTPGCQQKPSIWIDAGIHAREWIAVSTAQYLINGLIANYNNDSQVQQMRDTYDWYILPSVNPDGYAYTWDQDRMWRKTRQVYDGVACVGADANRNFDYMWMTIGASDVPCSSTYAGPSPYSEPEAQAQSDYIMARNGIWHMFITLHTYGQLWMSPWGYTTDLPANYPSLARVGQSAVQRIADTSGMVYQFGSAANILYESSGTSRDWAAGVPMIPFVYTIELRDENSFILPESEIQPTGEEIWAALKTAVTVMQVELPADCIVPE